MCLKTNTSYQSEHAIAIRDENVPSVDWNAYHKMREAVRMRTDLATFRQSRRFQV